MYKEMFDLTGRVAIVTGGSRGIGEAIAMALSEFGAKVVLASRKIEGLNAVKEKIEAAGGEAVCIPAHMGKTESLQSIIDGTLEAYGTIDILVNSAATNPVFGPMMMTADEAAWDKILDVNLKGIFFLTKAAAAVMAPRGKGSIINISTEAAVRPAPGLGIYSISKADDDIKQAVEGKIPLGRMAQPPEMAGLAVFLASDAAGFITGQTILADGGSMLC
jgi:NAD(P)-dependent dehydrogenase (short-subunit alcohol dehydrogenase family)